MPPDGGPGAAESRQDRPGHLRLSLRSAAQLFNSFDPSPFYEKDLDDDADQYLVGWARELHPRADLRLTLYLKEAPAEPEPERWLAHAIHHHFVERRRLTAGELRGLLRQGRASLAIGLAFLVATVLLASLSSGVLREGLTIAGWVAMWRPLQIYLYDWWPLWRKLRLYGRMSRMPVELRIG